MIIVLAAVSAAGAVWLVLRLLREVKLLTASLRNLQEQVEPMLAGIRDDAERAQAGLGGLGRERPGAAPDARLPS